MGIKCPNCSTTLGCGCQKRTARNGAQVCAKCIASYEAQLPSNPSIPKPTTTNLFQAKK
jgi:hypothetical protein